MSPPESTAGRSDTSDQLPANARHSENDDADAENDAGHAYSVLGINAENGNIIVRTPWGHGELTNDKGGALDGRDDGVFEVSVAEFKERFSDFSVQRA